MNNTPPEKVIETHGVRRIYQRSRYDWTCISCEVVDEIAALNWLTMSYDWQEVDREEL